MDKLRLLWLLVFLTGLTIAQVSSSGLRKSPPPIQLKTHLEENEIALNKMVLFHVELSWPGELDRVRFADMPQPVLTNLVMQGSASAHRLEPLTDSTYLAIKTITYQFKPVELGMAYINAFEVHYMDKASGHEDVLRSQQLRVKIVDAPPEAGSGVLATIYVVLLSAFALTIAYFLFTYLRKRTAAAPQSPVVKPLAETFLERFRTEINTRGENPGEMCERLSLLFREYLFLEFKIPASETGSAEVFKRLQSAGVRNGEIEELSKVFERLDLIKFAGEKTDPAEFSNMMGILETFISNRTTTAPGLSK